MRGEGGGGKQQRARSRGSPAEAAKKETLLWYGLRVTVL
jgi:hypothetical protein